MRLKEEIIYCSYCHLPNHVSSHTCSHCGESLKKDIIKSRVNKMLKYFLFLFLSLYIGVYISHPLLPPSLYNLLSISLKILKFSAIYLILMDTLVDPNLWRMKISKVFKNRYMNTSFIIFISNIIRWISKDSIHLEEKTYNILQNNLHKLLHNLKIEKIRTKGETRIYFPDNFKWIN